MNESITPEPDPNSRSIAIVPELRATGEMPLRSRFTIPPSMRSLIAFCGVLLVFVVTLAIRDELPVLVSPFHWQHALHAYRELAIVALGMLIVIVAGGIDLSVGSVMAFASVTAMQVYLLLVAWTHSLVAASVGAVVAALLVGSLCGTINGLSITVLRVSPFVTTLGMMSVARGLAMWMTDKTKINFPEGTEPPWLLPFHRVGSNVIFFNPGVWTVVILAIVLAVVLRYTIFGRYCYAIGSNEATAELCGIPVAQYKVSVYAISGLCAGWAGTLFLAKMRSGDPTIGMGMELEAIAAVVLGGASLTGGRGSVAGTLLGVLLLVLLGDLVGLTQAALELKYILIGGILIAYTAVNQWQRRGAE